ncbi:MAG TPA: hypothetical protein VHZ73_10060 [Vicinamibacterales bacterium]|nr:hypothetical protein [Vicinamibacterales bacterium]
MVFVIFTTLDATLRAARAAAELADSMGHDVTVVHFRPVSYAVPLESPIASSPAESHAFTTRLQWERLAATVRVCVCRSERDAAAAIIPPHSLVVVGGRRAWWPTHASRWQRTLEQLGHRVVLVNHPIPKSINHQTSHQTTKPPNHHIGRLRRA